MTPIVALLDYPKPDSFGLVAAVTSDRERLYVSGLHPDSTGRGRLDNTAELEQLILAGHALKVENAVVQGELPKNAVALWVGERFLTQAADLGIPPPPLPASPFYASGGQFYVGTPAEMVVYLETWIEHAFKRYLESNDLQYRRHVASLMRWTLPADVKTLAASWNAAANPNDELSWQLQVFGGRTSPEAWRKKLKHTLDSHEDPFRNIRIIAFTGESGTLRAERAEQLYAELRRSKQLADFDSYRKPLEREVPRRSMSESAYKHALMRQGQRDVERSPLYFTLSLGVFERQRTKAPNKPNLLVIDSVRHESIRDVLQWLGPGRLQLIDVQADPAKRRERLRQRGENPDELQRDPTESEIPKLANAPTTIRIDENEDVRTLIPQLRLQ